MTELLYQTEAYLKEFTAHVTAAEGNAVALDRTALYATGGGQPHDTGTLSGILTNGRVGERIWQVTEVRKQGDDVWHTLHGDGLPDVGLHPLLVFAAILVGATVAGGWGILFGIPIAGVVASVLQLVYSRATGEEPVASTADAPPLEAINQQRPVAGEPRPATNDRRPL